MRNKKRAARNLRKASPRRRRAARSPGPTRTSTACRLEAAAGTPRRGSAAAGTPVRSGRAGDEAGGRPRACLPHRRPVWGRGCAGGDGGQAAGCEHLRGLSQSVLCYDPGRRQKTTSKLAGEISTKGRGLKTHCFSSSLFRSWFQNKPGT